MWSEEDLIPALIENYLDAIEFISVHGLDEDFIFFVENKKLYTQLFKSKFLRHNQFKTMKEH